MVGYNVFVVVQVEKSLCGEEGEENGGRRGSGRRCFVLGRKRRVNFLFWMGVKESYTVPGQARQVQARLACERDGDTRCARSASWLRAQSGSGCTQRGVPIGKCQAYAVRLVHFYPSISARSPLAPAPSLSLVLAPSFPRKNIHHSLSDPTIAWSFQGAPGSRLRILL